MADRDEPPDLGIDTTPRGPARLGARHRPLVPSSRALAWSRAFWGLVGTVGMWLLWGVAWAALEGPGEPAERKPDPALERHERQREAGRERDRLRAEEEEAERIERVERLGPRLAALSPDRRLWVAATPEAMALEWAGRARPATYRVMSARKLMFVLIAQLQDTETGREWWLRAEMDPGAADVELRLTQGP